MAMCALLTASACGDKQLAIPFSFEVSIADWNLDPAPPAPPDYPDPLAFHLHLQPDEESISSGNAILGVFGQAIEGGYTRAGNTLTLFFNSEVRVPIDYPSAYCPADRVLILSEIQLTAHDDDGDDRADRLTGTTAGQVETRAGADYEYTDYQGSLQGVIDESPPRVIFRSIPDIVHPAAKMDIVVTEPIPGNTVLQLSSDAGDIIELTGDPTAEFPAAITTFPLIRERLSLGAEYTLTFSDGLRDLTDNRNEGPLPTLDAYPDPGLFPEDGFESGTYFSSNDAATLDSIGDIQPISGAVSLRIGDGAFTLIRVPVEPGDTHLRTRTRILFTGPTSTPIGGVIRLYGASPELQIAALLDEFRPEPGMEEPINPAGEWVASPEFDIELLLPPDAQDEVLVNIITAAEGPFCSLSPGIPPPVPLPYPALWIDDLRAE